MIDPPDGIVPDAEQIARVAEILGYTMDVKSAAKTMDEIARLTPTMTGVSYER